ncbi:MAG: hypothetical protein OP8BY_1742 [Candidatus Saccharicenans subterraneus]|uniref:Uncharacterized protein n=1 Tax=Candidatus Saccharicenans subterraneus TaxID=2508984 RepID=A0A3E2BPC7_9BACT|nr:MAG: hypothetical protein OP8BY_1742 [Candidatus Saccharicenans subterraneum]
MLINIFNLSRKSSYCLLRPAPADRVGQAASGQTAFFFGQNFII